MRRGLGMGLSCIGESVVNFLFSFRGGDIMPDFAYSGTLRNNRSQGKCPGCLLTALPKSAIFHTMVVVPSLNPLEVHISLLGAPSTLLASQ